MTWTNALKYERNIDHTEKPHVNLQFFLEYVKFMNVFIAFYHFINEFREPMSTRVI